MVSRHERVAGSHSWLACGHPWSTQLGRLPRSKMLVLFTAVVSLKWSGTLVVGRKIGKRAGGWSFFGNTMTESSGTGIGEEVFLSSTFGTALRESPTRCGKGQPDTVKPSMHTTATMTTRRRTVQGDGQRRREAMLWCWHLTSQNVCAQDDGFSDRSQVTYCT